MLLFSQPGFSQGIDFQHITFEEAIQKAKQEDKLIFIDFYTQWCGPCKKLAAGPFKEEAVGEFYNNHFINLKLDAEKEGATTAKKYKVNAYPTLMFIDGNGSLVYSGVGVTHGYDMVGFGKEAIASITDENNVENLQAMFPEKQNDEAFLKMYYQKMDELGLNSDDGFNAWLKVQTELKDDDLEMMRLLQRNNKSVYVGSKAYEIWKANSAAYRAQANDREKVMIDRFDDTAMIKSLEAAYRRKSPDLMRLYINAMHEKVRQGKRPIDFNYYELEYCLLSQDYAKYKKLATEYVDSLENENPVAQVHQKDTKDYESFVRLNGHSDDPNTIRMVEFYKQGRTASSIVKDVAEIGHKFLLHSDSEGDYKTLSGWIDYCYELIPEYYLVDNLKADMLYEQKDTAQAIELKEKAVANMPWTEKKRVNRQYELEIMKQGKELSGAVKER